MPRNFTARASIAEDFGFMEDPKYGISASGGSTERKFLLLTGATKAARAALGDAVLDGHSIEIKHATSNTLNQVRAAKYITLVAFHQPTAYWYVVPAHDVVILVTGKSRGQHTENPFESATLNLGNLRRFHVEVERELRGRVVAAIAESAEYPELRDEMSRVLAGSRALAAESVKRVRQAVELLGLSPLRNKND